MDMVVKKVAALTVLYLGHVTGLQVNVKVDVKLDGRNLNVTQVRTYHCLSIAKQAILGTDIICS